jgi:pimeloyl-ACP methyl ester carboxylesterase
MRLAFNRFGEGNAKNVVILHGLLGSKRNWFGFGKSLSDLGFNVWIIDQRNHGESEWSDEHTYICLAEDIKKFLEDHSIKNTYLIGHSMGGKAAMVLDKVYQGYVLKLVVVDIAPVNYPPSFENYLKVLAQLDLSSFKSRSEIDLKLSEYFEEKSFRSFLMQNLKLDDRKNLYWRVNLRSLLSNAASISEFPNINSVSNTNSLFLYGDLSEYGVAEHSDIIRENFPSSELVPVIKAGHWVHVEQPTKFLEIVTKFLKSD